jgi:3',5'-nucleoside bisphosphate phosphatase
MLYDLHVHTTASDGVNSPEEVIAKAVKRGLAGFAITDHDTVDGIEPARQFIENHNIDIDFIPGIELNTDYGQDEVHILGYFINHREQSLINKLNEIRLERFQRAEKMVAQLQALGCNINIEQVGQLAQGDLIGRPHIARALCKEGYALSEQEAFGKYIARGRPGYVPRYKFSPSEAIELIKQNGGVSILAHPGLIKDAATINEIIAMGLDGLEVYYPEHSIEQEYGFAKLARQNHLVKSGGSDFHGRGSGKTREQLGASGIDGDMMRQIRECYERKCTDLSK